MAKPMVAIVGRPNVGKSMLFNKLAGKRLSIVEDTPGVTRDRLYADCDWNGREFTIVDTGGIEPRNDNEILQFMRGQAEIAIDNADVIVLVCDIRTGVTAADQDVANLLLRSKKPVVLAVNKADRVGPTDPDVYEFYNLGLGDPIAISAIHGLGVDEMLDACFEYFPDEVEEAEQDLMKLHDYVKENFNYTMRYFRFPAGNFSERALAEVQQLGYKSLFWSFAYKDWLTDDQPDEAESLTKIVDSACPGMIYLLHAVSKTNANVLADVIDGVAAKGFTWGDPSKI